MLNNRIFLLEMHAVLISCFSVSVRASSVTEVVLLYSVSYGGNRTPGIKPKSSILNIFTSRKANVKIRSVGGSMFWDGSALQMAAGVSPLSGQGKLHLSFVVLCWNDRAKDFTPCVFHLFPGNPS